MNARSPATAAKPTRRDRENNPAAQLPTERYERVYVWELPVRLCHWTFAASITVLFVTGLLIAFPSFSKAGEPFEVFTMAQVRQIHFIAGFIFLVAYLLRSVWFLLGNRYARSGFPAPWTRKWWRDLRSQSMEYVTLEFGTPHAGHNALAGFSYFVFIGALGLIQLVTGFALFGEADPGGFWDSQVGWVIPLLGGSARVHMWHHLASWGFLVFAILHIYIVMLDARQYRNGLLVSMITGMKFKRVRRDDERPD
jgi:Ni/Fe-hydrogenase 1 B-type cytochrome subunit